MKRRFSVPLVITAFLVSTSLFTNCSFSTFVGAGSKSQETNTGNPMESHVTLSLSAFNSAAVTGLSLCPQSALFVSADTTQPNFTVNFSSAEIQAGTSDISLASFDLPIRIFSRVELAVSKLESCSESLKVTNSNGTFADNESEILRFEGTLDVKDTTHSVRLLVQPFVTAFEPAASVADVTTAVTSTAGQAQTPSALRFIQAHANSVNDSSGSVMTAGPPGPVPAGNFIICALYYQGAAVTALSVADNYGNTYSQSAATGPLNGWTIESWYTPNAVSDIGGLVVTATFTSPFSGQKTIACHEYAGVTFPLPVDAVAAAATMNANASVSPLGSTIPNEIVFAAGGFNGLSASSGPGFTPRTSVGDLITQDQIVNTLGSHGTSYVNPAGPSLHTMVLVKGSL